MLRKIRGLPAGSVLWILAASLYVLGLLAERFYYLDSVSCELPGGESVFGEAGWSWIPLGHTCTWENVGGGFTVVDYPSMMTLAPLMVLFLWGVSIVLSGRSGKPQLKDEQPPAKIAEER